MEFVDAEGATITVFAERQLAELFALPARGLLDAVVEAFDRHGVIGVVERRTELGQRLDGIIDRAAMQAGVQVGLRTGQADLEADDTAEGRRDDDLVGRRRSGVGQDDAIGLGEFGLMIVEEFGEARGADLLFAFDQEGDAQGQVRAALEQAGERGDRDQVRTLVVGRAAAIDLTVADHRLEGRGSPKIQRIGRLHVIVAIEDDVRPFLRTAAAAEDDRVEGGRDDFDLQARLLKQSADMLPGAVHARLEGRVGGHARVLHVIDQFTDEIHGFIRQGRERRATSRGHEDRRARGPDVNRVWSIEYGV